MEAQATQDYDLTLLDDSRPEPIPLQTLIELRQKGLSYAQIGKLTNRTKQAIHLRLKDIDIHIKSVKQFKQHKADILSIHQSIILDSLTPEAYKEASPYQRVGMLSYYDNMERLERGKATSNIGIEALVETRQTLEEASKEAQERKEEALRAIAQLQSGKASPAGGKGDE